MDQVRPQLSFGRYLRSVRIEKGIDLETVATATRIGTRILRQIEDEDHTHLPAEVFVKGFLRAYARQIGINGDDVVARYLAGRQSPTVVAESRRSSTVRPALRAWLRLSMALLGLAAIIAGSLAITLPPHQEPTAEPPAVTAPPVSVVASPSMPAPAPAIVPPEASPALPKVEPPPTTASPPAQRHTLQVRTLAPTWLKIIVDRRAPEEYSLKADDRLDFEAASGFRLLIGNAAGLQLTLDGHPVTINGRPGQVVTLTLP